MVKLIDWWRELRTMPMSMVGMDMAVRHTLWVGALSTHGRLGRSRSGWKVLLPAWHSKVQGITLCSKQEWQAWRLLRKVKRLCRIGVKWLLDCRGCFWSTVTLLLKGFVVLLLQHLEIVEVKYE